MGQSLSLAAQPGGSVGIDVPELSDITYEKTLGTARLMKCVRARHQDGLVVVKLVMKPLPTFELSKYVKALRYERTLLADVPNALGYQRIFETSTNGYLVRQYFYSSLYDRLSTRPFLEDIEKRWLSYQLLCALRDSHAREVYHGDVKTENILVTSWNWLYLTDYSASYKPTYLPEDNPADFSYYFDNSGRRTCYLAPERFLPSTEIEQGAGVTWAMDIFSVGCVIAELFTEAPIFNLSQLFKYRGGEFDPNYGYLDKIQDEDVREMVSHMIQVQPESRYSAEEYLNFWRRRAFPVYFYGFLHQYMASITDPSSGRSPVHPEQSNFGEADDRIDKVYLDFDKIAYFLGYDSAHQHRAEGNVEVSSSTNQILPVHINIPSYQHTAARASSDSRNDGTLIFLTLIVSSLRHTARSSSKIRACDLMLAFSERVTDEAKMDRVVPYLVALLNDRVENVKVAALRTLTQILSLVKTISPINAYAFTEYIKPRLQQFIGGPGPKASAIARSTYAACLAPLAQSAMMMVDVVQALNADGSLPDLQGDPESEMAHDTAYRNSFDSAKADLLDLFEMHTKALLTDRHPAVRRSLLGSVPGLCVIFGNARTNDVILSHLNTYLNDKDWILKCAFLRTVVGVAAFVGGAAVEEYILPLLVQSLFDRENFVVQEVLSSFATMAELGLLQRARVWEMVDICARYMVHPCAWVREAAIHFISASTRFLSVADCQCLIAPLLVPYLKTPIVDFSETSILDNVKKPLSSSILELALRWASNAKKSAFWKADQQKHTFSLIPTGLTLPMISSRDLPAGLFNRMERTEEDDQWVKRLRENGLGSEDELKLLALREHIRNLVFQGLTKGKETTDQDLRNILLLKDMQITPQTIFFEVEKPTPARRRSLSTQPEAEHKAVKQHLQSHTIADALLDASTTIAETKAKEPGNSNRGLEDHQPQFFRAPRGTSHSIEVHGEALQGTSRPPRNGKFAKESSEPSHGSQRDDVRDETGDSQSAAEPSLSRRPSGISERHRLKQKPSVMQLLNRHETMKTVADTSTNNTNALATFKGSPTMQASPWTTGNALKDLQVHEPKLASHMTHSYTGNDPTVMNFLDSLAHDNYPRDVIDFGPQVAPVHKRQSSSTADIRDEHLCKPRGILMANFGEHTGPINRILPSPDHAFFITGSDDGTIKIWDTSRLERNLTHRSRYTFTPSQGSAVKAMAFVENTYTFISAQGDGSIKAIKLDQIPGSESLRYGKPRVVREYQLPKGERAVWLDHNKIDAVSLLLIATSQARIIALDLRAMDELYVLRNPVHHGTPTCFHVNHKQGWLILGTSHGVLDLWDLRFQLRLKAWSFAGAKAIHRIVMSPFHPKKRAVCIAGGTGESELTFWDLDKVECIEVMRIVHAEKANITISTRPYEAWKVDEEKPGGMLGRFATAIDPRAEGPRRNDNGLRALLCRGDTDSASDADSCTGIILAGGVDRKVRCWMYPSFETSMVVSGLNHQEPPPKYFTNHTLPHLTVRTELNEQAVEGSEKGGASKKLSKQQARSSHGEASGRGEDTEGFDIEKQRRKASTQSKNTLVTEQQRALLKSHLDDITDICLLESPIRLIVSVDRMGSIQVFQ